MASRAPPVVPNGLELMRGEASVRLCADGERVAGGHMTCPGSTTGGEVAFTTLQDATVYVNAGRYARLSPSEQTAVACHELGHVRSIEETFGPMEAGGTMRDIWTRHGCADGYDTSPQCDQEAVADDVCNALVARSASSGALFGDKRMAYQCDHPQGRPVQTLVPLSEPLADHCGAPGVKYARHYPHAMKDSSDGSAHGGR